MELRMKWIALLLLAMSVDAGTSFAQMDPEGIYSGSMTITDGPIREVPLQLSISFSGEMEIVDGVERQVIDSSFLVDDEGGPFGFSTVRLNLEANVLELTYLRPQVSNIANTPSFQLKGRFNDKNELEGDVFSGRFGLVGKFKLAKNAKKMMTLDRKYQGRWVGKMTYLPEDKQEDFEISMAESYVPMTNPSEYEFEYTRGKASGFTINGFADSFTHTFIDYLHRKFYMTLISADGDTNLSVDMHLSDDYRTATGNFNSIYGGRRGVFVLKKLKE